MRVQFLAVTESVQFYTVFANVAGQADQMVGWPDTHLKYVGLPETRQV